jgi:hypothetical protein
MSRPVLRDALAPWSPASAQGRSIKIHYAEVAVDAVRRGQRR